MIALSLPDSAWEDVEPGTEALLERWLVEVGAQVRAGQAVASAVLIKTNYEIAAPEDGVIADILIPADSTFGRGAPLALLETESGAAADRVAPTAEAPAGAGAGVEGPADAISQVLPMTGLRGSVARQMSLAWQAPQVAMGVEVEMTRCLARLDALRRAQPDVRITITALVIRAAALALKVHPGMNARLTERGIELLDAAHVALAVSLDEGLGTPVIRDADRKSVVEIAGEAQRLAAAARDGSLPPSALQGGTFTVTNLGMTGIDWFTPVLNSPQVGILGVSRVTQRAIVRDAAVVPAPLLMLTLVFDHRAVDGYPAAVFLADVRRRLEDASEL